MRKKATSAETEPTTSSKKKSQTEKNPENVRRGKNSRRKGASWDLEVRDFLKSFFPCKRGFQTRGAKQDNVADVTGETLPWWIECKTGQIQWASAIKQSMEECGDMPWMVFAKAERILESIKGGEAFNKSARVVMMNVTALHDILVLAQLGAHHYPQQGAHTSVSRLALKFIQGQQDNGKESTDPLDPPQD